MLITPVQNKGCDVLLVSPPSRRYSPYLPIGLLYLSSFLEKQGLSTKILYFTMELRNSLLYVADRLINRGNSKDRFRDYIIEETLRNKPLAVGLSCCTTEYSWTMNIAKEIKANTGTKVIVGGIHAALKPEDFIYKFSPVDFVVIGEGETPLAQLIYCLKGHKPLSSVSHIGYLGENGLPVLGGCNIEPDISGFPWPDYSKVDMGYFLKPSDKHIRNILLSGVEIFTSRGCPYGCEFCANNFLGQESSSSTRVRNRNIDQVIEELKFLKKNYAIDGFYILDDCFLLSKSRVADFCEKLINSRLKLVWAAETRVNLLNDESLLKLMKKAGLVQFDFGVESGSPAMLEEIRKGITVEQTRKAFELCRKNNIRSFANIMFNLPGETENDVMLTENLLDEIKPTVVSMMLTVPYLGTKIYDKYVSPKLSPVEYDIYNKDAFSAIPDKRFFLAHHSLDFTSLLTRLYGKYNKLSRSICSSPDYWAAILRSRRFSDYLLLFLLAPFDLALGFCLWLDARVLKNALRKTVRRFTGNFSAQ
jgi:anaerobic magnesium-protoporphyrin IX monomethyl ester cyclase